MPIPAGTSAQALTQKLENMRDDKDLQPTEFAEPVGVGGGVEPDHENETQDTYCPIPVDATAHPQESGGPNDVRPKDVPRESGGPKDVPQESDGAKDVPQEFDGANDVPRESGGAYDGPQESDGPTESDLYFPERTTGEDGETSDIDMDDAMLQSMLHGNVSELNPRQFVQIFTLKTDTYIIIYM